MRTGTVDGALDCWPSSYLAYPSAFIDPIADGFNHPNACTWGGLSREAGTRANHSFEAKPWLVVAAGLSLHPSRRPPRRSSSAQPFARHHLEAAERGFVTENGAHLIHVFMDPQAARLVLSGKCT